MRLPRFTPIIRTCALALVLLPVGCISYSLDQLPPSPELPAPLPPDQRPSVSYTIRTSGSADSLWGTSNAPGLGFSGLDAEVVAALSNSGLFSTVQPAMPDKTADLQLDIALTVDTNDVLLVAGAVTAFIIPTWRTVSFDLAVEAHAGADTWKRYHLQDAARDINWLPLLLGMSFAPWSSAYDDVRQNMYRTAMLQLREDGFVRKPHATPPSTVPATVPATAPAK